MIGKIVGPAATDTNRTNDKMGGFRELKTRDFFLPFCLFK